MKLSTWLVLGGLGLGGLEACGKAGSGEQVGGETHWLRHCSETGDSEAECGPDLECACGVCTAACDTDSACEALDSAARCSRPSATEFASACVMAVPERICVRAQNQTPEVSEGVPLEGLRYNAERDCLEPLAVAGTMAMDLPCSAAVTYAFRGDECWQFPGSCVPDDFAVRGPIFVEDPCYVARECRETSSCGDGQVATVDGCLSCDAARVRIEQTVTDFLTSAGYDTCSSDADCVAPGWNDECWAGCFVPLAEASVSNFVAELSQATSGYCSDPAAWMTRCGGVPDFDCLVPTPICRAGICVASDEPPCADRPLETCAADGDCALARAFPLDTDQQCFTGESVEVGCIDPDLSCPPVTTPALDGDGNCFMFGNCLPAGFVRAPAEHACTLANGSTCSN